MGHDATVSLINLIKNLYAMQTGLDLLDRETAMAKCDALIAQVPVDPAPSPPAP